jgi:pyroglutamyl-peptidase
MNLRPVAPVRVLVTGFGPFPGVPVNASGAVIETLERAAAAPGMSLFTQIIPVTWADAREVARGTITRVKPHAVLHFGVSRRLTGFEIETRAINISGPKEDHAGAVRPAEPLERFGKTFLNATLPSTALLMALRQRGLPVQLSKDAGRYLCNALLYWSLMELGKNGPLAGFVHMPALGADSEVQPRLTLEQCVLGARILIRASAQAVLRARHNGNSIRGDGYGDGSQAFHGIDRSGRRAIWRPHR